MAVSLPALASTPSSRRKLLLLGGAALLAAAALVVVLMLAGEDPSSANSSRARGAAALPDEPTPEESAQVLVPSPGQAGSDRGPIIADGCMVGQTGTRSAPCTYGDRHGKWTVVLFGDSHAMQYFPALQLLAKKNHWRLVVLNKRECTPADTQVLRPETGGEYRQCDIWHAGSLRRIESYGHHATVVLSGDKITRAFVHGQALEGSANAAALEHGYVKTLKRIRRAGLGAAVIRDMPSAPHSIPQCVAKHRDHMRDCAFPRSHNPDLEFDARAAEAVPGVGLIDLTPQVCPDELCRAVIGNVLVYRDEHHLSATYAKTLSPWIARGLRADHVPFRGG